MATVRPISPQYQHTLDSAISLAKELASKNMAESGDSSPKTPNSPDKKRFNFKLKHFNKSFSEASANIRDIESSISNEAKQAYKSLVERGPYNNSFGSHSYTPHHTSYRHSHQMMDIHGHSPGHSPPLSGHPHRSPTYANDELMLNDCASHASSSKFSKHSYTMKKSFF